MILFLPATLVFALLVYHCAAVKSPRTAATFFIPLLLFGYIREWAIHLNPDTAEYHFRSIGLQAGGVPIVIPMGWAIAIYLGWLMGEAMLWPFPRLRRRIFATITAALLGVMAVCFCVEVAGANAGWWVWNMDRIYNEVFIFNMPRFIFIGWSVTAALFLGIYFTVERSPFRRHPHKLRTLALVLAGLVACAVVLSRLIPVWRGVPAVLSLIFLFVFFLGPRMIRAEFDREHMAEHICARAGAPPPAR